ncbi:MAGE-domain-containing protein [Melanogaster broomeanus]|nr:MAGE-domain-containing protein [Melanogaster broomeanus]
MARAGPSRSQRSQREPQPSQYQSQRPSRGRRRAVAEEDDEDADADEGGEEEEDGEQEGHEMDIDNTQVRKAAGDTDLDRKASDLVRLALFTEHRRVPLRREEINKKVLGSNTRSFNVVFEKAQRILRKTFAMELVELQSRNYREQDPAVGDDLQTATGVKKKGICLVWLPIGLSNLYLSCIAAAAGSKTYILRSVLDISVIEQAALTDERLLEEQLAEGPDDEDDEDMARNYGSVISWSSSDQLAALGVLHVILALILVNGRSISELDLRANLKRLRIPSTGTVPMNAQSTHKALSIDLFLGQLMRQGYIDRVRTGDNKAAGGKRGRGPAATQVNADDNQAYEWRWGTRAHSEIGEQGVGSFVAEFMVERTRQDDGDGDEDDEENGGPARGRGRGWQSVLKGIERAAGGNLADIK